MSISQPTKLQVTLPATMSYDIDTLAEQLGVNRANAIRYCIKCTCDAKLTTKRT